MAQTTKHGARPTVSAAPVIDAAIGREFLRYLEHHLERDPRQIYDPSVLRLIGRTRTGDLIGARVMVDLYHQAARALDRHDIGLAFARWVSVRELGLMPLFYEHLSCLEDLLRAAAKYMPSEHSALTFRVERCESEVRIVYTIAPDLQRFAEQFMEASLLMGTKVIQNLLGSAWRPLGIELQHSLSSRKRGAQDAFRAPVRDQAPDYAIVLAPSDLLTRRGSQDNIIFEIVQHHLDERAGRASHDFATEVKQTIIWQLRGGSATVDATAAALAIGPRTLQRRLRLAGTDFGTLLSIVRAQIAEANLLRDPNLPFGQLATLLGYSEPSAVGRFLRQHFGTKCSFLRKSLAGTENR